MFAHTDLLLNSECLIDQALGGDAYHIAFAADQNYLPYIGIALFSILENNPDLPLHFHLFIDDMPAAEAERFRRLHSPRHPRFRISLYHLNPTAFTLLHTTAHFSPAIYYRLAIPALLHAQHIQQVLYLDTDILCTGELSSLLTIPLEQAAVGAAADVHMPYNRQADGTCYIHRLEALGLQPHSIYFNSGVLLINIPQWIQLAIENKIQNLYQSSGTSLDYPDQDILNIVLQNHLRLLPERYNCLHWEHKDWLTTLEQQAPVSILHFIGRYKPWHLPPNSLPIYARYTADSPWRDHVYRHPPHFGSASGYRRYAKHLWQQNQTTQAAHYYLQYLLRKTRLIR